MPTKEDVLNLFALWQNSSRYCDCPDHNPQRKIICERELAWRTYVKARDQLFGLVKLRKEFDIDTILDAFEAEHDN